MTVLGGDTLRVTAVQSFGVAASAMNVYSFRCLGTGPWDDADVMEVVEVHLSSIYNHTNAFTVSLINPVEIRAFNDTQNAPIATVPWTTWAGGTAAQEPLPYGVAILVLFRTSVPRVLGRKFLPGCGEGNCSGAAFDATVLAGATAYAGNLMTDYTDVGLGLTLQYRIKDKFGGEHIPSEAVVSLNPAYQRRRRAGRGV